MRTHHGCSARQRTVRLSLAAALAGMAAAGQTAEVQLGVRAFAQDTSIDVSDSRIDGGNFSTPPTGSATATFAAGVARADAYVQATR